MISKPARKTRAEERAYRNALYARLRPIAVELLSMMYGRSYTDTSHNHLVSRHVCNVHPETLLRATRHAHLKIVDDTSAWLTNDAHMIECTRRAAISKAWFEKVLGEPVGREESLFWLAERWDALGRPKSKPCDWDGA